MARKSRPDLPEEERLSATDTTTRARAPRDAHRDAQGELLALLHDVTAFANESETAEEAIRYAIRQFLGFSGWSAGRYWSVDDGGPVLTNVSGASDAAGRWLISTPNKGEGRTASVRISDAVKTGRPRWVRDLRRSKHPADREAASVMRTVVIVPVMVEFHVGGVLEFFAASVFSRDEGLLKAIQNVGVQLGHVISRRRLETHIADLEMLERRDLGSELKENLAQSLAGTAMMAATLGKQLERPADRQLLARIAGGLESAREQVQTLTEALHVIESEADGLVVALETLARRTQALHRVRCRVVFRGNAAIGDSFVATQLFMIAREAVHNAVRHSGGDRIQIRLERDAPLRLAILDNGRGIGKGRPGDPMGIKIMRQRARLAEGRLEIQAGAGGGTVVTYEAVHQPLILRQRR